MVSFSRACMFLALTAAPAAAQRTLQEDETVMEEEETVSVQLCDGDALAVVSHGCTDAEACKLAAEEQGLQVGGVDEPFVGPWSDKGCYYYPADHPLYPNQAYFGEAGSCAELRMQPMAGALRVSCDGTPFDPFEPERCPGELCIDAQGCQEAALAMGLTLGSAEYPFEGDYTIKGCVYFPDTDPLYPNEAYWGTGASICGQLRAEPTDGSKRITCSGNGAAEETEETVVTEEVTEPETEASFPEQTTEAPVATPVTRPPVAAASNATFSDFNATAPASAPVLEDEENQNDKDDKEEDDKEEDDKEEDDGPDAQISAIESDELSSASSNGVRGIFVLSAIVSFFSVNL